VYSIFELISPKNCQKKEKRVLVNALRGVWKRKGVLQISKKEWGLFQENRPSLNNPEGLMWGGGERA